MVCFSEWVSMWRRRCFLVSSRSVSSASVGKGGHHVPALFSREKLGVHLPSEMVLVFCLFVEGFLGYFFVILGLFFCLFC